MDDNEARLSTIEDVLAKAVLDIAKIERFLANLGPLVNVSERLAQCERLLTYHELDIEKNGVNVDALLEEAKILKAQSKTLVESWRKQMDEFRSALESVENNRAEPPAETAALALYGGEQ